MYALEAQVAQLPLRMPAAAIVLGMSHEPLLHRPLQSGYRLSLVKSAAHH